jgi:uncharacterized protein DUF3667
VNDGGEVVVARGCANCGAPLSGAYCSACGQRDEPHIHSLWGFLSEAAESVTHADSRVWRTLWPLLVKPGFLTKEFLEGRRARYLPPFRLYLVLSVAFFLAAVIGGGEVRVLSVGVPADKPLSGVTAVMPFNETRPGETPDQRAHRICDNLHSDVPGLEKRFQQGCRKIVIDNGRSLAEAFYHNIPRGLIVLLPLLALVMRLMYLRRHYVEHLLFFVHTHAFTFLFLTIFVLLVHFIPWDSVTDTLTLAMMLILPYYGYRAMLRVYGQGKWVTRLKFTVLAFSYFTLVTIMAVFLGLYTVATL